MPAPEETYLVMVLSIVCSQPESRRRGLNQRRVLTWIDACPARGLPRCSSPYVRRAQGVPRKNGQLTD